MLNIDALSYQVDGLERNFSIATFGRTLENIQMIQANTCADTRARMAAMYKNVDRTNPVKTKRNRESSSGRLLFEGFRS